jgi:AAA domain
VREWTNAQLDAEVIALDAKRSEPRIKLMPFSKIKLGTNRRYLVKGVIPFPGLTVIWGSPKSGKSFWTLDLTMHVALGREYRGKRVQQGPVVYCCFEGQSGISARVRPFASASLLRMPRACPSISSTRANGLDQRASRPDCRYSKPGKLSGGRRARHIEPQPKWLGEQ